MAAQQNPSSLGFSRQEYWSGLPFPSPMRACTPSHFSRVWLYATLWTAANQPPLSTGFSKQEYWHGLPFPSPMRNNSVEIKINQIKTSKGYLCRTCYKRGVNHYHMHFGRNSKQAKEWGKFCSGKKGKKVSGIPWMEAVSVEKLQTG